MSKNVINNKLSVTIAGTSEVISHIYELEKIGAGHDGYVYRFNDRALKILKYDIKLRKEKRLMTFDKAIYFRNKLNLERIVHPIDILLDEDGIYTGYVMKYVDNLSSEKKRGSPQFREPGSYSCGDFVNSWQILEDDFKKLSDNRVLAKDINRGSYLFGYDFIYLCDTDKYEIHSSPRDLNHSTLNYTMAKLLAYEMEKTNIYDKSQKRLLDQWVKKASNSRSFYHEILSDVASNYSTSISEYADYKVKKLLR